MSRTALLAGATGLVGSHALQLLLADDTWARVITVGRRPVAQSHAKLEQRILDLGAIEAVSDLPHADDVFCCLGTTIKQAGSQPAFRRVDHDFVVALARAGVRGGATQLLLVSAVGADSESRIFYSRVKGEAEMAVRKLPYRAVQIFRPSILLGKRAEFRLGERVAVFVAPVMPLFLPGGLRRYRPVAAATVARAMVNIAREMPRGMNVYEYDGITAHGE
ncbi:MAG TPA: NAD(P)H-binding protein [Gemmatimonadales bacterium]|nr:NAD(P)H-binding protein [Gemmatimonadales bacterium]